MADEARDNADDIGDLDPAKPFSIASYWQVELGLAERDQKTYIDEGRGVYARYKSEKVASSRKSDSRRINILYSNTETLRSALYGRTAKPDVRRRFADRDPAGRTAADVIERALIYFTDVGDVDSPIEQGVLDYLLPGRGTVRVEYEPVIKTRPQLDMMTGVPLVDDQGEAATEEFIADQKVRSKYVYWEDFRCSSARGWQGVWWVAFRHTFTRSELRAEIFDNAPATSKVFGTADEVPLNWSPDAADKQKLPEHLRKAEVWELWHKPGQKRYWIVDGYMKPLRIDEDPYKLEDFWPLPEPITGYATTDTIIPQAEFLAYENQADDLDEINRRISVLTTALKFRGVYDASIKELAELSKASDNRFIPVENYGALTAKGGLQAAFQAVDISTIAAVLTQLYQQRDMLVQTIYEITGIADILRGASDPDETLGAQKIKAQFGSARLKRRQRSIQKWVRDLYRIKGEIVIKHFQPDILTQITGIPVTPEVMAVLGDDAQRCYRIDIETDSTIFEDAQAQQQQRISMVTAMTQFVIEWGPVIQQRPQLLPLAFEALKWSVRVFPASRELEEKIEEAETALTQAAQQAQGQPPQDPKLQIAQLKVQGDTIKAQAQVQSAQIQGQSRVADAQVDAQASAAKMQAAQQQHEFDMRATAAQHAQTMEHAAQQHALSMDHLQQDAQAKAMIRQASVPAGGASQPAAPKAPAQKAKLARPPPGVPAKGNDGEWYLADHQRPGKYLRVHINA